MFDIETLGVASNSVVLSAAMIKFEADDTRTFHELVESACFVKFNIEEQKEMGRNVSHETLDWWEKQSDIAKQTSLYPSSQDMLVTDGIEKFCKYISDNGGNEQIFWTRGSLDQIVFDSLCRSSGMNTVTHYNKWRDVRTAVDFLGSNPINGYCKIKNFNPDLYVIKHVPQHDCALDIMMLVHHE